ncbi:MAG: cadherin-like domain-containing protein [Betaproteobacteria bacterium]|nr:cadherin-like domain-containing protein [Betaproteobacteria bacterium]
MDSATITLQVAPVNDAPVGTPDHVTTTLETLVSITPLVNDTDAEGDALLIFLLDRPGGGGVVRMSEDSRSLLYTPDASFVGTDTIRYQPFDGTALGEVTTITVDVTGPKLAWSNRNVGAVREGTPGVSGGGSLFFTLVRSGDTSSIATVTLDLVGNIDLDTAPADLTDVAEVRGATRDPMSFDEFPYYFVTFAVGQTEAVIEVVTAPDTALEPDEMISLRMIRSTGVGLPFSLVFHHVDWFEQGAAIGHVLDDDSPVVEIATVTEQVLEGTAPGAGAAGTVVFHRSGDLSAPTTVTYVLEADARAGASSASADDLVDGFGTRTVTIPAGRDQWTVDFTTTADRIREPDETFVVRVTSVEGGTIGAGSSRVVTITNDDPATSDISLDSRILVDGDIVGVDEFGSRAGTTYTLRLTSRNAADADAAADARVRITFPDAAIDWRGLLPEDADVQVDDISASGMQTLWWQVGALAPGESADLDLQLASLLPTEVQLLAEVWESTAPDADSTPGNGVGAHEDDALAVVLYATPGDPPIARADTYTVGEGRTLTVPASQGLLANDTLSPGSTFQVSGSHPGATLNVAADGSFTFDAPRVDSVDTDYAFSYVVTDAFGQTSAPTAVTFHVQDRPHTFNYSVGIDVASPTIDAITGVQTLRFWLENVGTETIEAGSLRLGFDNFTVTDVRSTGVVTLLPGSAAVFASLLPDTATFSFTDLAVGEIAEVVFTGFSPRGGVGRVGLEITGATIDGDVLSASQYSLILESPAWTVIPPTADLSLSTVLLVDGAPVGIDEIGVAAGTEFTLRLVAENAAIARAAESAVRLTFPIGALDLRGVLPETADLTYEPVGSDGVQVLTWRPGALNAGASATLDLVVSPLVPLENLFRAEIVSSSVPDSDSTPGNGAGHAFGAEDDEVKVVFYGTPGAAPVVRADSFTVAEGGTLTLPPSQGLLVNDDVLRGSIITVSGSHPGVTLNVAADGGITFVAPSGITATSVYVYSYTVTDAFGQTSAPATITVQVDDRPSPIGQSDAYVVFEGETLDVSALLGLLANDAPAPGTQVASHSRAIGRHGDGEFRWRVHLRRAGRGDRRHLRHLRLRARGCAGATLGADPRDRARRKPPAVRRRVGGGPACTIGVRLRHDAAVGHGARAQRRPERGRRDAGGVRVPGLLGGECHHGLGRVRVRHRHRIVDRGTACGRRQHRSRDHHGNGHGRRHAAPHGGDHAGASHGRGRARSRQHRRKRHGAGRGRRGDGHLDREPAERGSGCLRESRHDAHADRWRECRDLREHLERKWSHGGQRCRAGPFREFPGYCVHAGTRQLRRHDRRVDGGYFGAERRGGDASRGQQSCSRMGPGERVCKSRDGQRGGQRRSQHQQQRGSRAVVCCCTERGSGCLRESRHDAHADRWRECRDLREHLERKWSHGGQRCRAGPFREFPGDCVHAGTWQLRRRDRRVDGGHFGAERRGGDASRGQQSCSRMGPGERVCKSRDGQRGGQRRSQHQQQRGSRAVVCCCTERGSGCLRESKRRTPIVGESVETSVSIWNGSGLTVDNAVVRVHFVNFQVTAFTPERGSYDAATGVWTVGTLGPNDAVGMRLVGNSPAAGWVLVSVFASPVTVNGVANVDRNTNNNEDREQWSVPLPPRPSGLPDDYTTDEGVALVVPEATGLLSNDRQSRFTIVDSVTPPTLGTLQHQSDGSFTYTPPRHVVGDQRATFVYTLRDASGQLSDPVEVSIVVRDVIVPADLSLAMQMVVGGVVQTGAHFGFDPGETFTLRLVARNDGPGTADAVVVRLPLSGEDFDVLGTLPEDADLVRDDFGYLWNVGTLEAGDAVTFDVELRTHRRGTFEMHAAIVQSTSPDPDSTLNNGVAEDDEAGFTVEVENAAPVARPDRYVAEPGVTLQVAGPGMLGNDTDANGDALFLDFGALDTTGLQGDLTFVSSDGSFEFRPADGFTGTTGFTYGVRDVFGDVTLGTVTLDVIPRPLVVTAFTPTVSGFRMTFDQAIDPSTLQPFGEAGRPAGITDLELVGGTSGRVRGSVIVDPDGRGLSFVRSGGALAPDTYTVTVRGDELGVRSGFGGRLDGNGDGTAGDDFTGHFTVRATDGSTLGLPDLVRGPGQTAVLPVSLTQAAGVTELQFDLLDAGSDLGVMALNFSGGLTGSIALTAIRDGLHATVVFDKPLEPGTRTPLTLDVGMLAPTAYGTAHRIAWGDITLKRGARGPVETVRGDDAVQVSAYFLDASGNGGYSMLDVQRLQRVLSGQDRALDSYPLVDPVLIGDLNGNGQLTSLDVNRFMQFVQGQARPEIPALPAGSSPLAFGGPARNVGLGGSGSASAGDLVSIPLTIDTSTGVESLTAKIVYDASRLEYKGVRLATDFPYRLVKHVAGEFVLDLARLNALGSGLTELLEIDFQVKAGAAEGGAAIDLQVLTLNDGKLSQSPASQAGVDGTDAQITVVAVQPPAPVMLRSTAASVETGNLVLPVPGPETNGGGAPQVNWSVPLATPEPAAPTPATATTGDDWKKTAWAKDLTQRLAQMSMAVAQPQAQGKTGMLKTLLAALTRH